MYAPTSASKIDESGNFLRQGSLRKVVPPDPTKEILYQKQNEEVDKLYKAFRQEYIILAEYKMVQTEEIKGLYVIPSKENALVWFGVIFIRNGFFDDGVFRFQLFLNENFPDGDHPKVVFQSKLFHPVIDPQCGEVYLLKAFPKWNKSDQHIWQVLKYIQWIFYNVEDSLEHAINEDAANLVRNDAEQFKVRAEECVKSSITQLYDESPTDDPHYISFEPYSPDIHDKVRVSMLSPAETRPSKMGLSWVSPGSNKSLTCPPTPPSDNES